jgi:2-aminobenzoate-CoA ligase
MSTLNLHPSAHEDSFTRDNLPRGDLWPDMVFDLPELQYGDQLNVVTELLDNAVEEGYGDKIALYSSRGNLTYRQFQGYANQLANMLIGMTDFKLGNRVLLRGPNEPGLAVCLFAVLKAGGVAVTTMPMLRAGELTKIIKKADISHALCLPNMMDELLEAQASCPSLKHIIPLDGKTEFETFLGSFTKKFETVKTSSDDVALLAFTSGTTGEPKACMHMHRDIMSMVHTYSKHILKPSKDDVFAGSPPLAFTYGLGGMLIFPMAARASAVLEPKPGPESLLDQIETFKVTTIFTAPTAYRTMMNRLEDRDISSLHTCVSAGETLPKAVFDEWESITGIRLLDGIGSTELFHIFIAAEKDKLVPGATGVPVAGFEACILGPDNEPLGDNEVGRLAVKGPTGCRYLDDDRQKNYVVNGWNVTGDAYIRDENGYYWFQARTDDIILSGGYNIAGPEVENALLTHPAILEAAVVGWPDELRGNIVKAFCVIKEGFEASEILKGDLQNHVKGTIAPFKYPRIIEFIDELPKTQTGKLQRFKLQKQD